MGMVWAVLCGDLLTDLEYLTRPYEVTPGQTDEVLKQSADYLYEVFRRRPLRGKKWGSLAWHLSTDYFTNALREVKKQWDAIEVDRLQVKPMVKITGEFWLQTQEGAEIIAPPIAIWLYDWMRFYVQEFEARRGVDRYVPLKIQTVKTLQWVFRTTYNRLRKALGYLPHAIPNQYELQKLAAPYFHQRLSGGEGDMLVGKALHAYHHKTAHMICELTPYSCMPNTMSIGAMANVSGDYPDLLYAPIEIKGDAEIHALSRCQMILTEAKKRAQQEFEQVLDQTGLSLDRLRDYEAQHTSVKQVTHRVGHHGVAGTAANYALDLAEQI